MNTQKYTVVLCLICSSSAAHAFPVFDAAALAENIQQRILFLEQWTRDNKHQINQLTHLDESNALLDASKTLLNQNFLMDAKQSWAAVEKVRADSLALISASQSIWEEYGSAQQYFAAFQKAEAWTRCFQSQHCNFQKVKDELHNAGMDQAVQASQTAFAVQNKLKLQMQELQALNREAQQTHSLAGTIDALSKINATATHALMDLNLQISQITQIQSHALAEQQESALLHAAFLEEIARNTTAPDVTVPSTLPQ